MRWLAVACLLASCATGIPDPPVPPDAGVVKAQTADAQPAAPQCVPGASAVCTCSTGRTGAQVCGQAGTFGACTCAATAGSTTSTGTSTPDAGTLPDLRPATPDAGVVVDSLPKLDVFDSIVNSLCVTRASAFYSCEDPSLYWRNDAGQIVSPPDAAMSNVPWTCVSRWKCLSCTRLGSTAVVAPEIACDNFGTIMCVCNGLEYPPSGG